MSQMSDSSSVPPKRARRYTAEDKAKIVRQHLVEKVPISDICDEHQIRPSVVYSWIKQVMENLNVLFDGGVRSSQPSPSSREVDALKAKLSKQEAALAKKDSVIAEISSEYVALKKTYGDP